MAFERQDIRVLFYSLTYLIFFSRCRQSY